MLARSVLGQYTLGEKQTETIINKIIAILLSPLSNFHQPSRGEVNTPDQNNGSVYFQFLDEIFQGKQCHMTVFAECSSSSINTRTIHKGLNGTTNAFDKTPAPVLITTSIRPLA